MQLQATVTSSLTVKWMVRRANRLSTFFEITHDGWCLPHITYWFYDRVHHCQRRVILNEHDVIIGSRETTSPKQSLSILPDFAIHRASQSARLFTAHRILLQYHTNSSSRAVSVCVRCRLAVVDEEHGISRQFLVQSHPSHCCGAMCTVQQMRYNGIRSLKVE